MAKTGNSQSIHRDGAEYRLDANETRGARGAENRATEKMEYSDEERLAILRQDRSSTILPDIPSSGEWHYCWLTNKNPSDPIWRRKIAGYQLVTWSEMPELQHINTNSASEGEHITVNEMVLGRTSKAFYQKIMNQNHGELPARLLSGMTAASDLMNNFMASQSARGLNITDPKQLSEYVTTPRSHSMMSNEGVSMKDVFARKAAQAEQFNEFPD